MWNLSGDDIQRAKAELTGRRAAIQAKYDNEIKQLAADLAALETFERAAVSFVSNYKGPDGAAETAAVASEPGGPTSQETPVAQSAAAEPAPGPAPAAAEKSSSRWRMRLGTGEASPQGGDEPA